MNCFSCFRSQNSLKSNGKDDNAKQVNEFPMLETMKQNGECENCGGAGDGEMATHAFAFRELATATRNFRQDCLLGDGGFGKLYKGTLASSGQVVAVKQLDRNGLQAGNKEFLAEVMSLSRLHHPNLLNLIGYCADGDQRLLVHEYMPMGSIDGLLFGLGPEQRPLDWLTRMKIALGTANALDYLHEKANPPITYRDLKPSNILLDEDYTAKLSDVGLAKLGHSGNNMTLTSRVMGTYGYCAPEYSKGGQPTSKSDVYSFGVILLELITGRRAIDTTKPNDEQNLVSWAQPLFRDPKRYPDMADPLLNKQFPEKDLNQAVAIAAMCLQEEPTARPLMSDIVTTLGFLSASTVDPAPLPPSVPPLSEERRSDVDHHHNSEDSDSSAGEETDQETEDEEVESSDQEHAEDGHHPNQMMVDHDNNDSYSDEESVEDESISSSHRKSQRSQDGSISTRRIDSNPPQYDDNSGESAYSSNQSSWVSRVSSGKASSFSQKSSRKSVNRSSRKSRDGNTSRKSSRKSQKSIKSQKSTASSLSHNSSSMGSDDGNKFLAYKISGAYSIGSYDTNSFEDDRSGKGSQDNSVRSSS